MAYDNKINLKKPTPLKKASGCSEIKKELKIK